MGMTIDEAIARAKERSDKNGDCWKHCIAAGYCERCEKEHEQLVEWLEELKDLREKKKVFEKQGYNKGVDDFIKRCDKHCGFYAGENKILTREDILLIAKQLKEKDNGNL